MNGSLGKRYVFAATQTSIQIPVLLCIWPFQAVLSEDMSPMSRCRSTCVNLLSLSIGLSALPPGLSS